MINLYNGTEPIINPWLFYLADLVDGVKTFVFIVGTIWAMISVGLIFGIIISSAMYGAEDSDKKALKRLKISLVASAIVILVGTLLPSKSTLYSMTIAKALTPDTVQLIYEETGKTANDILNEGVEAIEEILDYGVDKIDELRKGE